MPEVDSPRVAVLGNRLLAVKVAGELWRRHGGDNLLLLCNPSDSGRDDAFGASLEAFARANGLRHLKPASINQAEAQKALADFSPDVCWSCSYEKIIQPPIIAIPGRGFFNIHYALLPRNRGCYPVVWSLMEKNLGVTLHAVAPGIDAGAVHLQAEVAWRPGMTGKEAYGACAAAGYALFCRYWTDFLAGAPPRGVPQAEGNATYHGLRHPYDRWVQWRLPAGEVADFVNALTNPPHPAARSEFSGREIRISGPCFPLADAAPGGDPGRFRLTGDRGGAVVACGLGAVSVNLPGDFPAGPAEGLLFSPEVEL